MASPLPAESTATARLPAKPTDKPWLAKLWFKDHCKTVGGDSPLVPCRVWGVVYLEDEVEFRLCYWSADGTYDGDNCETLTVAKALVEKILWLYEEDLAEQAAA